jgi:hypothetical protein
MLWFSRNLSVSLSYPGEDAMEQEQIERAWFVRIVAVVMLACVSVGAVPVIYNTLFPVAKTR